MEEVKFKIFKKSKKKYVTLSNINLLLLILSLFILIIKFEFIYSFDSVYSYFLLFIVSINIFLSFRSYFVHPPLGGDIEGFIKFSFDSIQINSVKYDIDKINNIEFSINSYYGGIAYGLSKIEGRLSNGVNNSIKIRLFNNQEIKILFQLEKNEFKKIRNIIIHYDKLDKINLSAL